MSTLATILIAGDYSERFKGLATALSECFEVKEVAGPEEATSLLSSITGPAIVLVGDNTRGASGLDVNPLISAPSSGRAVPVVVLTDTPNDADHLTAIGLGATDYLSTSVSIQVLNVRLRALVENQERVQRTAILLTEEIEKKDRELLMAQEIAVTAMASMAEIRDPDTVNHIRRTQNYVRTLARKLSAHPQYSRVLSMSYIATLFKAAPLHDIGKTGIPDRILLKPGKLTAEETAIMRTHPALGLSIIEGAEMASEASIPLFTVAKEIIYSHHEKWDGSGYPQGLSADQIPLAARLMALADVYDALISRRPYKESMSHESAVEIIQSSSGRHFDPNVVNAFVEVNASFKAIAIAHCDAPLDYQKKADYKAIVYPNYKD